MHAYKSRFRSNMIMLDYFGNETNVKTISINMLYDI